MKRLTFLLFGMIALGGILYYSMPSGPAEEEYKNLINQERQGKNNFMKNDESSPFVSGAKTFDSLKYFEPNSRYRFRAALEPIQNKKVIQLSTSTGETNRYLEYAWATFELDGIENKLLILELMDMGPNRGKLFLAFADETSTLETYGGGRYLDLKKIPAASSIELDFNQAYNPYCAYDESYSCPLPPHQNVLQVAIRAGEKIYK